MKSQLTKHTLTLTCASALVFASSVNASTTFSAISSYDPDIYFAGGFTAGIDFDEGPTLAGATGIPASNNTSYSVSNGGITFDITINNSNTGNQNRDRGSGTVIAPHGDLTRDFEQWFNNSGTGVLVDGVISLSGLVPNTEYDIDVFAYNIGSGQTTTSFYDGDSIAAPLITTFTTAGNDNDQATWSPGLTLSVTSDSNGEYDFTTQSSSGSRLTMNGVVLYQGSTVPEPSSMALLGLCGLTQILRRRR